MALIGYARCSTSDQSTNLQIDALKAAGCERIFEDQISGATVSRPGLDEAISYMRPGDILVVWKLDRLGRSLKHVIETVTTLAEREVGFHSLTEQINTSSNAGKLVLHVFAALAEFERGIIKERVCAGLEAARRRGRVGGRPRIVDDSKTAAIKALREKQMTTQEICKTLGISRASYFRYK